MNKIDYKYGLTFPLELENGKPTNADFTKSVEASIHTILSWPVYRRQFDLPFGSIAHYLWWPGSLDNLEVLSKAIREGILDNDRRVTNCLVNIKTEGGSVFIEVEAVLKTREVITVKTEV